jgi:PIN domain nuclease of toxin-antitoxin system
MLWHLEDDPKLGATVRAVLAGRDSRLVIPTIVLAEVRWGLRKKRVADEVWSDLITNVQSDSRFTIYPLTAEVVDEVPAELEMHDAMICATATLLAKATGDDVQVLTRDQDIIRSGLVASAW